MTTTRTIVILFHRFKKEISSFAFFFLVLGLLLSYSNEINIPIINNIPENKTLININLAIWNKTKSKPSKKLYSATNLEIAGIKYNNNKTI